MSREQALGLAWSGEYPDSLVIEHKIDQRFREIARAWPEYFRKELDKACTAARAKNSSGV